MVGHHANTHINNHQCDLTFCIECVKEISDKRIWLEVITADPVVINI